MFIWKGEVFCGIDKFVSYFFKYYYYEGEICFVSYSYDRV